MHTTIQRCSAHSSSDKESVYLMNKNQRNPENVDN